MKRKKDEEYRESQITINIFDFSFYIRHYILFENII